MGHERHAQTKGVWFWSQPQVFQAGNEVAKNSPGKDNKISVLYVDTEGFEATGKVYVNEI